MILLDGKKTAQELRHQVRSAALTWQDKGIKLKLVIIMVGDDPASQSYIRAKQKACEEAGILSELIRYKADEITTAQLIDKIHSLNEDPSVHGILVQLPLPDHLYAPDVIKAINPAKDVDGFTAYNLGKMLLSTEFEDLVPCTPKGIITLLETYNIAVEGKEVVVVGRSNIVGKPVAMMLINRGATVTVCHSKTQNLALYTGRADILIVAIGKPHFVTSDMVKDGATVIDVGINRTDDGQLVGDTDFETVSEKAAYITPVPGGCGPMTVACLLQNVVKAAEKQYS